MHCSTEASDSNSLVGLRLTLGEPDKALDLLERAYEKRDYSIMYLKVHPNLDPLRSDPRFKDLLRRSTRGMKQK